MKVIYNWLKEFVEFGATPAELRARLSISGTSVDSIEESTAGPVLDAELNANRPDCLGHYGIAREVAALYGTALKPLAPKFSESGTDVGSAVKVRVEAPEVCQRFTGRVIRGVKVQPSPDWLRQRLEALGHTSINNVVDVSNYVMFELGQPLHAFDLDKLSGAEIVVRLAQAGEEIRTLDGMKRTLTRQMCVIADGARATSIAGVMGGAESEIGFSTRNVLVEAAMWDPISIRRTSKALNLRSEASMRFERGADIEMAEMAARRAVELITQLGGGEVLRGVVDIYPAPRQAAEIELSSAEIVRVMGEPVAEAEVERTLGALGFAPRRRGSSSGAGAAWSCTQPSWRGDVTREIDLIEEVARIYGYDKFPPRLPAAKRPAARLEHATAEDLVRQRLVGLGYQEIVTIPLVGRKADAIFRGAAAPAVILNPLSEEADVMRGSGAVGMVTALEWNLNHGQQNLRLFEIGTAYSLEGREPVERRVVTLGATGAAREKSVWEGAREFGFADLKGDLEWVGEGAGGFVWKAGGPAWLAGSERAEIWSAGTADAAGEPLGVAGKVARRAVAEDFKLSQDVFVGELALEPLFTAMEGANRTRKYEPLPRFPAVERDFSVLLPEETEFSQIVDAIRALGIEEARNIEAVDLYRGKNVPTGKYSMLVRMTFQSSESTFTDAQLGDFSARIIGALEKQVGAVLRAK
jgi:phenylalanyl-tRNA synthetase beta chain